MALAGEGHFSTTVDGQTYLTAEALSLAKSLGHEIVPHSVRVEVGSASLARSSAAETVSGANGNDVSIPDYSDGPGWAYSDVTISDAPEGATVTEVRVGTRIVHTYPGDLVLEVWNDGVTFRFWDRLGGADDGGWDADGDTDDDIEDVRSTSVYNGRPVNGTWYLDAYDYAAYDTGYIDFVVFEIDFESDSGSGEPDIDVTPSSIEATAEPGDTVYRELEIENDGDEPLSFSVTGAVGSTANARVDARLALAVTLQEVPVPVRVPASLTTEVARRPSDPVDVIVRIQTDFPVKLTPLAEAERSAQVSAVSERVAEFTSAALAAGAESVRRVSTDLPFVSMRVDAGALEWLASDPRVVSIREDRALIAHALPTYDVPRSLLDDSIPLVGADVAQAAGFDGDGTSVAIIDTGVDRFHPHFNQGGVVREACFSIDSGSRTTGCPGGGVEEYGAGAAEPLTSHGSHVAAIAAGTYGVAPRATILAANVFHLQQDPDECDGAAPCAKAMTTDIAEGMAWAYQNRSQYNLAAVNLSLGNKTENAVACDDAGDPIYIEALRLANAGVLVISSAGNEEYTNGIGYPACMSPIVAVGGTDKDDEVGVTFTNSGDLVDLWAPGRRIVAAVPGGGTDSKTGTSMSAPHVTGAAASLRQQGVTGDQARTRIVTTGDPITDPRNGLTRRRLRVDQALGLNGGGGGDWLAIDVTGGTLQPGSSQMIGVNLDANGLGDGTYDGEIEIQSNDPDEPVVTVPIAFTVSGSGTGNPGGDGPDLRILSASYGGGSVEAGTEATIEYTIQNAGNERVMGHVSGSSYKSCFWLSTDASFNADSDVYVGCDSIQENVHAPAGWTSDRDEDENVPDVSPGTYQLFVYADYDEDSPGSGRVAETVETNNLFGPVAVTVTSSGSAGIDVQPTSVSFGTVSVGASATRSLTVSNTGTAALAVDVDVDCPAFALAGSGSFSVSAGASRDVTVRFEPSGAGAASCSAVVSSNAGSDIIVALSGVGSASGGGVVVSAPTTSVGSGTSFELPVNVSGLGTDVISFSMVVGYDPTVVEVDGVSVNGTLADGFNVSANPTTGRISVSAASASPFSTDGVLVILTGQAVGDGTSPVTFESAVFNEGTPAVSTQDGSVSVSACVCGDASGDSSVSAYDAALILRHEVGLPYDTFSACGADASGNGQITSYDASLVLQSVSGISGTLMCSSGANSATTSAARSMGASWRIVERLAGRVRVAVDIPAGTRSVSLSGAALASGTVVDVPTGWAVAYNAEGHLATAGPADAGVPLVIEVPADGADLVADVAFDEGQASALRPLAVGPDVSEWAVSPPRPNPTTSSVSMSVDVPVEAEVGQVRVVVVDALGRVVADALRDLPAGGRREVTVDLAGLAPGVYVAVVTAPSGDRFSHRFTIIR